MFILTLHGQWDSDLVSDTLIMDGVTEEATGDTLHTAGATRDIGDQDGVIQDTDLTTDTIITLIVMEEEVLPLITEEETTVMIEAIATETTAIEATAATEATLTEISAIKTTLQTEEIIQQTETGILTLEEVLQTQILQTEEVLLRDKAIVTTILTEDQAATQQPEITTVVITAHQQEATLLAHHVL